MDIITLVLIAVLCLFSGSVLGYYVRQNIAKRRAGSLEARLQKRVVDVKEEGKIKISPETLAYLNRLSSLLYALARVASHLEGAEEIKPDYK